MKKFIILAALAVGACAPQAIALRDARTHQAIECRADPWTVLDINGWNEECARKYERNGFERLK